MGKALLLPCMTDLPGCWSSRAALRCRGVTLPRGHQGRLDGGRTALLPVLNQHIAERHSCTTTLHRQHTAERGGGLCDAEEFGPLRGQWVAVDAGPALLPCKIIVNNLLAM